MSYHILFINMEISETYVERYHRKQADSFSKEISISFSYKYRMKFAVDYQYPRLDINIVRQTRL